MYRSLARAWFAGLLALTLAAVLVAGVRADEALRFGGPQPPTSVFPATRITLSQPCSQPGQPLGVSGVGFAPNVQVSLSVDATAAGTAMTAANGSFSATITIPGTLQPGQHLVQAVPPAGSQVNASFQYSLMGNGARPLWRTVSSTL